MQNEELKIIPVKNYEPPKIPTLSENNSEALKKLPSRWKKNAKIIACVGLLGTLSFSQLATPIRVNSSEYEVAFLDDLLDRYVKNGLHLRAHFGGSGAGTPFYLVHFTEQEALNIISEQLEDVGFYFSAPPKQIENFGNQPREIKLFEANKNIAIMLLDSDNIRFFEFDDDTSIQKGISERFAEQTDIPVGVLALRGEVPEDDWWIEKPFHSKEIWDSVDFHLREPLKNIHDLTENAQLEARALLENEISAQVKNFLEFLHSEGILSDSPRSPRAINVRLNGKRLQFETPPMMVNNFAMVPFREIFRALGFEIEWHDDSRTAIAKNGKIKIELPINSQTAFVNGEEKIRDSSAIIHDGRIFVPLRFISEAAGAEVEWFAYSRTAFISAPRREIDGLILTINREENRHRIQLSPAAMEKIILEEFAAEGIILSAPTENLSVTAKQQNESSLIEEEAKINFINAELGIATAFFHKHENFSVLSSLERDQIEGVTVGLLHEVDTRLLGPWLGINPREADVLNAGSHMRGLFAEQVQHIIRLLRDDMNFHAQ